MQIFCIAGGSNSRTGFNLMKESIPQRSGEQNHFGVENSYPADFGSWIQENVWAPVYNALIVETHNTARQTINNLTNSEVIKDRLQTLKTSEAQMGSLEWWSQNIVSGIAAGGIYAGVGKLTGGALRAIAGGAEKACLPLMTSKLAYNNRALTKTIGKVGNFVTRVTVNDKTGTILGAGLYDGAKELHEGETHAGNMAGGMACFGLIEAGNGYINSKFKLAGLGLSLTIKQEALKTSARLVPGALGNVAHTVVSHTISGNELPTDSKTWNESLVTGAAMNAVLPWAQHGLGKGIDAVGKHIPVKMPFVSKGIPLEHYRSNVESALLKELRKELPLSRVKPAEETKAEGQNGRIYLSKGATEAHEAHELWHIQAKRNLDRAHELREVGDLIKKDQLVEAKEKYIAMRIKEEVLANEVEHAVKSGKELQLSDFKWDAVDNTHPLWEKIAADSKYQQQFQSDFAKLANSNGKIVVETDYISEKLRGFIDNHDVKGAIEYLFPKLGTKEALLLKDAAGAWGKSNPGESPVNALIGLKSSAFIKVLNSIKISDTELHENVAERFWENSPSFESELSEMQELHDKLMKAADAKEELVSILTEVIDARLEKYEEIREKLGDEYYEENRSHHDYIYETDSYEIPESLRKNLEELGFDADIDEQMLSQYGLDSSQIEIYGEMVHPFMEEFEAALGEKSIATLLAKSDLFDEGVGNAERKQLPLESILNLSRFFGNQADVWIQKNSRLGRSLHDYAYWLPDGAPSEVVGLPEFLMRNYRRRTPELEMIAKKWNHLNADERKLSVDQILEVLQSRVYPNIQAQEFANEAIKYGIEEGDYADYERRFIDSQLVDSPFPLESSWTEGDLRGRFLPRSDVRGLFLGHYTDCCQHPEGQGRRCAWYGQEKPNSGFFVVENAKTGEIVAQSWTWVSKDGGLCFDNIEGTRDCNYKYDREVGDIYQAAANDLSSKYYTITLGTQSTDIRTGRWTDAGKNKLELPSDFQGYTDASSQVLLAKSSSKPVEPVLLQAH